MLEGLQVLTAEPAAVPDGVVSFGEAEQTIAEKLRKRLENADARGGAIDTLFPDGMPLSKDFYRTLDELHQFAGVGKDVDHAIGALWLESLVRLGTGKDSRLLSTLFDLHPTEVFGVLGGLPFVLPKLELDPAFLSAWLVRLADLIRNDYADAPFWEAVAAFSNERPHAAVECLDLLRSIDGGSADRIAATMLGRLRSLDPAPADFPKLDDAFRFHESEAKRVAWTDSFFTTSGCRPLSDSEFELLLGSPTTSFENSALLRCLLSLRHFERLTEPQLERVEDWISAHLLKATSQDDTLSVLWALNRDLVWLDSDESMESRWFYAILPVSAGESLVLERIHDFMCSAICSDVTRFAVLFDRLTDTSTDALRLILESSRGRSIIREMQDGESDVIAFGCLFGDTSAKRKLGLRLIERLDIRAIPDDVLLKQNAVSLSLLLYELNLIHLSAPTEAIVLIAIASQYDRLTENVQADLEQCILHNVLSRESSAGLSSSRTCRLLSRR